MKMICKVNGAEVEADVPDRLLLSDFLRHELRLTGTHVGCEMGACGACTVIVDGAPLRSCLMFAAQADGARITTIEGLAGWPDGEAVIRAFSENHALQCGYCTPGLLTTVLSAMSRGLLPESEAEIREFLSGNLCRCTGYQGLVDAVRALRRQQSKAAA